MKSLKWLAIGIGLVVLGCSTEYPLRVLDTELTRLYEGDEIILKAKMNLEGSGTITSIWHYWYYWEHEKYRTTDELVGDELFIPDSGMYTTQVTLAREYLPSDTVWYQLFIYEEIIHVEKETPTSFDTTHTLIGISDEVLEVHR